MYPVFAIQNGLAGIVKVQFTVSNKGRASQLGILEGLGEPLDTAAIQAVNKALYLPRYSGQTVIATVIFSLNQQTAPAR